MTSRAVSGGRWPADHAEVVHGWTRRHGATLGRVSGRTDRAIAARPERVYAALVDPDALAAWRPPDGMSGRFERLDGRPGGSYRMIPTHANAPTAPAGEPRHVPRARRRHASRRVGPMRSVAWRRPGDMTDRRPTLECFDARGVRRTYDASLRDDVLRMWRDAPGFDQRFAATLGRTPSRVSGSSPGRRCVEGRSADDCAGGGRPASGVRRRSRGPSRSSRPG